LIDGSPAERLPRKADFGVVQPLVLQPSCSEWARGVTAGVLFSDAVVNLRLDTPAGEENSHELQTRSAWDSRIRQRVASAAYTAEVAAAAAPTDSVAPKIAAPVANKQVVNVVKTAMPCYTMQGSKQVVYNKSRDPVILQLISSTCYI